MRSTRSYVASYTIRQGHVELFNIHLHKQLGFYQISEFASENSKNNFIIEQTNKVGKPKIAAFEKDTGQMLGLLRGNILLNDSDETLVELKLARDLPENLISQLEPYNPDDYVAIAFNGSNAYIVAVYYRLPKKDEDKSLLRVARRLAKLFSGDPKDIFELEIWDEKVTDERNLFAIAVILHSRRI